MPSVTKLSVSVPTELAQAAKRLAGPGGLSSLVTRALSHELQRSQMRAFLDELRDELGPIPTKDLDDAKRTFRGWSKR